MKDDMKDTKKVSKKDQVRANNVIDIEPKLNEELDEIEALAEQLAEFETLSEAPLNFAQRLQRALIMRKYKTKIAAARKRMARKLPSVDQIKNRARKAAIKAIRKKVAGKKGMDYANLSASEKAMIDKRVEQRKSAIAKIAARLIPQIRKAAVAKLSADNQPSDKNESFSAFVEELDTIKQDDNTPDTPKKMEDEAPARKKRFHFMFTKEGKIKTDLRFRAFRHLKNIKEDVNSDEELIELIDALSEEVYSSMSLSEEKDIMALKNKAIEYRVPYEIVEEVYKRGVATWSEENTATPQQAGFARVNSFLAGGKTFFKEDADLAEDMGSKNHHLGIGSSFKHMQKHAVTHIDKDMDSDVDDLEDMGSDEITGTEKKDFTKIMMKKYDLEKKHTKKGDAFEEVQFKNIDEAFEAYLESSDPCWKGYKKVKGKKDYEEDSCVKEEKSAPSDIKRGDWVIVSKKEHAQVSKYGGTTFTYNKNKLPASSEKMYVDKITKTKDGRKAHMRYDPNSMKGFAVMLDQLPDFMDVTVVKEESGAGEWGTDKLAKKYKKDTPKQDVNEAFEMMLEDAQCALISQKDIKELEKFADTLLKDFGLDVEFTRHFGDRMSDDRNNPCITIGELKNFFRKVYANKGTKIKGNAGIEAVIKDVQTKLNMPVVIDRVGGGEVEVRFKTIMRKQNFTSPNRTIQY